MKLKRHSAKDRTDILNAVVAEYARETRELVARLSIYHLPNLANVVRVADNSTLKKILFGVRRDGTNWVNLCERTPGL